MNVGTPASLHPAPLPPVSFALLHDGIGIMEPFQQIGASPALLLAPDDNIAVAVRDMPAGTSVRVGESSVTLAEAVKVGHKFAIRPIAQDERVTKYGAPIGRAVRAIAPGEYVHIHNVTSDYLPTYTFDAGHEFLKESH